MQRRELYLPNFHIDTNLINSRGKLEAMNRLEKWAEQGLICINISDTGMSEALAGDDGKRTKKALAQIYTINDAEVDKSSKQYQQVSGALFPEGVKTKNQENDVAIVMEAAKYQAILVTNDGDSKSQPGGILGNRDKLKSHVQIMRPDEAVDFVKAKIHERDEFNRRVVREFGGELPEWTGKD